MFLVFDEKFTAYAEIDSVVIDLNGDDDLVFPLEVGISSDAVVEGAHSLSSMQTMISLQRTRVQSQHLAQSHSNLS
jgi:hypothetical protein